MSYHRALSPSSNSETELETTNTTNTMGADNQKLTRDEENKPGIWVDDDNSILNSSVNIQTFNESVKIPEYKTSGSSELIYTLI